MMWLRFMASHRLLQAPDGSSAACFNETKKQLPSPQRRLDPDAAPLLLDEVFCEVKPQAGAFRVLMNGQTAEGGKDPLQLFRRDSGTVVRHGNDAATIDDIGIDEDPTDLFLGEFHGIRQQIVENLAQGRLSADDAGIQLGQNDFDAFAIQLGAKPFDRLT